MRKSCAARGEDKLRTIHSYAKLFARTDPA